MDLSLLLAPLAPRAMDSLSGLPSQCGSENNLKFICEFERGKASGDEEHDVGVVTVILPAQCSVYQLRLRICMQVQKNNWMVCCY